MDSFEKKRLSQVQGETMDKVILALGHRKSARLGRNVDLHGLYVGLSRVRSGKNLRIWPKKSEHDLDYLKTQKRALGKGKGGVGHEDEDVRKTAGGARSDEE